MRKGRMRSAVSLRYDGERAPLVTAKGRGELAERLLAIAKEHDIPIHEDPQLAALLACIEPGEQIPPELYVAIAQVLSFAYALSGKSVPGRAGNSN